MSSNLRFATWDPRNPPASCGYPGCQPTHHVLTHRPTKIQGQSRTLKNTMFAKKKLLRAITHKSPWNFWHLDFFLPKAIQYMVWVYLKIGDTQFQGIIISFLMSLWTLLFFGIYPIFRHTALTYLHSSKFRIHWKQISWGTAQQSIKMYQASTLAESTNKKHQNGCLNCCYIVKSWKRNIMKSLLRVMKFRAKPNLPIGVMVKVASVASIRSCVWPFCRKSSSAHSSTPHIFKNDQVSNPQEGELQQLAKYFPSNMIFSSPSVWLSSSFTNSFVVVIDWLPVDACADLTKSHWCWHSITSGAHAAEYSAECAQWDVRIATVTILYTLPSRHSIHLIPSNGIQWKENNKYFSPNDLDICQVARDSSYLPLTELIASRPLKPKRSQLKTAWRDAKKTDWTSCCWVVLGCNICTQ